MVSINIVHPAQANLGQALFHGQKQFGIGQCLFDTGVGPGQVFARQQFSNQVRSLVSSVGHHGCFGVVALACSN